MGEDQTRMMQRLVAARLRLEGAVEREHIRAAFKAAGAKELDEQAIEAAALLAEEKLAEIAARSAELSEDMHEPRLTALSVAVAAERSRG